MPERRIIIGPCRSGTTMLLRSFRNHPAALTEFQTIKKGQRQDGAPDHRFFSRPVPADKFLIDKETIGYGTDEDCTLSVFPDDDAIRATRPLFIFREPRSTFESWLKNNLVHPGEDIRHFLQAFRHTYALLLHAIDVSGDVSVVTYEQLCRESRRHLEHICRKWDMPFHPGMLVWNDDFLASGGLDQDGIREGHYATVAARTTIGDAPQKQPLDPSVDRKITDALGETYRSICVLAESD
jgi:hypothetical protein